ncbi:hypothetical protein PCANC_10673 [Puccinia coronata f. sp. avenae]|uniref:Uncharacterized protein n=1 Tax=Puccinia coronata f. sp. avenae TaxID=200324 RepID=A0A2N5VG72_9BASI|nr:hypothetical protein PCANC_10673 [Puccinia coronata f. sp. avenae]
MERIFRGVVTFWFGRSGERGTLPGGLGGAIIESIDACQNGGHGVKDVAHLVLKSITAGINRLNTAARAVLEQPCSTGVRTDTVRPKQEPTGRTDLSDRSRLVLCNQSQELIGQACPTRQQVLRSDSACPTTG